MVINLSESNSLLTHFISEIRDVERQRDKMRFRKNLERIGEISAYEISKAINLGKNRSYYPTRNG